MDSEQIKKDLSNEALLNISSPFHPEGQASAEPAPDHRKLKGQVVAEPSEKGGLTPTEYPVDPWNHDVASVEQKLVSDISQLSTAAISDKVELKKRLADLYKQTHELMTRYNQRVQSLLMDDRFLYRHVSEISALMIRGLMPPLEQIKSLEKSLTSTRKKTAEEPIEALQQSAAAELQNVENVLKDAKNRITRHTRPLKPEQLIQKQLDQRLERAASELQQHVQKTGATMPLSSTANATSDVLPTVKAESVSTVPAHPAVLADHKPRERACSAEDLTSKQLSTLALELDTASEEARQRISRSILSYVASEYRYYVPLRPLLSVARQKSELLSINPDKTCKACQDAIALLEDCTSGSEIDLSLDTLMTIDRAINKLASFDKKLPGEVWQLLTELTPDQTDGRYHLLNLLCRKLLLDGPTPLTQKAILNKFHDVSQLLSQFRENAGDELFYQQFIAVYGQIFNTPAHLKKTLNMANKPHEVQALLQIFSHQNQDKQPQLAEAIEKARTTGDEQQLECLLSGASAFDGLVTRLPDRLATEIRDYRPSEPNQKHKQLAQSVLSQYTDYSKALELTRKQGKAVHQPQHRPCEPDQIEHSTVEHSPVAHREPLSRFSKQLTGLLIDSDSSQAALLEDINNELQTIIHQPPVNPQVRQSLARCRVTVINALRQAVLTSHQASMVIKGFLEAQTLIEEPGAAGENGFQAPEALLQAMACLENGTSPKWYNQLFTGQLQACRFNTLGLANHIFNACRQTAATTMPIASFIEVTAGEITRDNDDPLIKQLGSEMQAYARQLKMP